MSHSEMIKEELQNFADGEKALFLPKYFKVFPGGYGEGDQFIGVTVPNQRKIARKYYKKTGLEDLAALLKDPIHEYRLTAMFVLVYKFEREKSEPARKAMVEFYIRHLSRVNNWDLVDASADKILGVYLFDKNKDLLYDLANSGDLWMQRVAIMATFYFIRNHVYEDTLKIARTLLRHEHDLIHKAVGWMLREIGKRDFAVEYEFLREHSSSMPRTMLRYAIEKFEPGLRKSFLG